MLNIVNWNLMRVFQNETNRRLILPLLQFGGNQKQLIYKVSSKTVTLCKLNLEKIYSYHH